MPLSNSGPVRGEAISILGTMGSGKTHALIQRLLSRPVHVRGAVLYQPPGVSRIGEGAAQSRTYATFRPAITVADPLEMIRLTRPETHTVAIEEFEFYERDQRLMRRFMRGVETLLEDGHDVIGTGLPLDFRKVPFKIVTWFWEISTERYHLMADCEACGAKGKAWLPQRLIFGYPAPKNHPRFVPDTKKWQRLGISYESRCSSCYVPPGRLHPQLRAIYRFADEEKRTRRTGPRR